MVTHINTFFLHYKNIRTQLIQKKKIRYIERRFDRIKFGCQLTLELPF